MLLATAVPILMAMTLTLAVMPAMAKPTQVTVPSYRAMFSWCGWSGPQDMLSLTIYPSSTSTDYRLTGNVLHTVIPSYYGPQVQQQEGTFAYTYNKKADIWILHEDPIVVDFIHNYPYYGYNVTVYFRGYLEFSGTPSAETFEHGAVYEWVYANAPESDTGPSRIWGNVKWDSTVGAWLISFNINIFDKAPLPYTGPIAFPTPLPEPIPAKNYNQLGF